MARRRVKKTAKQVAASSPVSNVNQNDAAVRESQIEDEDPSLLDQEVERQSAAIRAMRDVEIEHSLTGLRLLRSYFNEKQFQTPAFDFFKQNFPNLSILRNEESGEFEVNWNDKIGNLSMGFSDGRDIHASLLHRIEEFVLEGPSDNQTLVKQDGLQTPGVNSQRLSIGMTPKTLRLPKPGEMLLSVRGSPLGVYKEDNMEAIHESEEG
ncbi:hypothetical protein CFOL_v3_28104 [Cephalotus follicularis]|uniref:Borealin C-terminal domain-containing protein n=1 Tax=Cephalotus follicularis TaxID=3775 RepID=A0A1Q3CWV5_CEPFO|nr:hypothetical protein CFOL_v3_28104 [Cephalotus follicularis]